MQTRAVGRAVLVGLPVAPNGPVSAASGPGEAQWSWRRRQIAGFEDGCGGDIWIRVVGFPIPAENLPKTRSGKIMRRLLRSIAKGEAVTQDTSTLENPAILEQLGQAW